jgi:hypothetical protein
MPKAKTYFEQIPLKAIAKIVEERTQEQPDGPEEQAVAEKKDAQQSRREHVRSV